MKIVWTNSEDLIRILPKPPHRPAVACEPCSAMVPESFIFGRTVYHPKGRDCEAIS